MSAPHPDFGEVFPGASSEAQRDDSKKRRWLSRSDEEIAEHMDNRNLAYRTGWPQLPPLPVSEIRKDARESVSNPRHIIETVQVLCRAQNVEPIQIYFAFRAPEVRQNDEDYLTLVVAIDYSNNPMLFSLIIQIRKLLQEAKNDEIYIEIIDHRVVHGLYTFAILPGTGSLANNWVQVYDTALAEIRRHKEQFLMVEMLRRGLEDDITKCPPTLVITSPTATEDIWIQDILPAIRRRILVLQPSLKVELLCGSKFRLTSSGEVQHPETYKKTVSMGVSIGQQGMNSHSGTAGGMVKLSNGTKYALTNHHVVRNQVLDELLMSNSKFGDDGIALKPNNPSFIASKHRFECPSLEDHNAFLERRINDKKLFEAKGDSIANAQIARLRKEFDMARSASRNFATLHASSGLRWFRCEKMLTNPENGQPKQATNKRRFQFMLDWALLTFPSGRDMMNRLPNFDDIGKEVESGKRLAPLLECSQWTVMENPKCNILRDEVKVSKFGRTTRFTNGIINDIPTVINPTIHDGEYKSMSKAYGFTVQDSGTALSIVPREGRKDGAIVLPGDSGSVVLHDPSGDWLGLIFGETKAGAALFTPIDIVFRDIEQVTGFKVVEPEFNPK